ncbi:MAG: YihA family ribosome biogenesis GTP-binding protein [Gammaproteobacteria bacterium]|nr:YihA family ribosome biogenesis GTP-binding protein [Gammaproteobacteria bacterium]
MNYQQAHYLMGAAELKQLPAEDGIEVAFAGRSNAGKSSALNALTQQKALARVSKTPGRTQLINLFGLTEGRRIVDLPGYGYAKVSLEMKARWQATLSKYLLQRRCLKGLVLVMDIRHPLKDTDQQMVQWAAERGLALHCLLSKADKLSRMEQNKSLFAVQKALKNLGDTASVQVFSAHAGIGLDALRARMDGWYAEESSEL